MIQNNAPKIAGKTARRWSSILKIPKDEVTGYLVAYAVRRHFGDKALEKLIRHVDRPFGTWERFKITLALALVARDTRRDEWGELYRITNFARIWGMRV